MEFIDDFLSDDAISTLEILTYLRDIGSHRFINEIIFDGRRDRYEVLLFGERRNYRVFMDDITSDIIDYFTDIDKQIIDNIVIETLENDDITDNTDRFAKYYDWNRINKIKDDSFKSINVNVSLWRLFVQESKKNNIKVEDSFKISIIKFLERRYLLAMDAQRLLATDIFKSSYMALNDERSIPNVMPMIHNYGTSD